ncbi:MAG: lactate racemase domain-containing protein [Gemmataceae bacterium]
MNVRMPFGRQHLDLDLAADRCLGVFRGPSPLPDPAHAVRQALEVPWRYPPLRRALTPDDRVVVVVDETLPQLGELLPVVLEHVASAGVPAAAVTLLCPPGDAAHPWIDDLPDEFGDVHVEDHDPTNRQHLAYLATTKSGRRVYLNRTLVDADQVVVVGSRRYDLLLGYAGGEGSLFPTFSDEPTRDELDHRFHAAVPGSRPWPLREQAIEVALLLGQPFYVQGIASAWRRGGACGRRRRRLDARGATPARRQLAAHPDRAAGDGRCHANGRPGTDRVSRTGRGDRGGWPGGTARRAGGGGVRGGGRLAAGVRVDAARRRSADRGGGAGEDAARRLRGGVAVGARGDRRPRVGAQPAAGRPGGRPVRHPARRPGPGSAAGRRRRNLPVSGGRPADDAGGWVSGGDSGEKNLFHIPNYSSGM